MFTGIVQGTAKIVQNARALDHSVHCLGVQLPDYLEISTIALGTSIAINGVCLTVQSIEEQCAYFEVTQETLRCTALADYQIGQSVNIERSARLGDEIGGHMLSGHVDCSTEVLAVQQIGETRSLQLRNDQAYAAYLFDKGSIALNGVSLTLTHVTLEIFSIMLISETIKRTTFAEIQVGDTVHVEVDMQAKILVDTVKRFSAMTQ